MNSLFLPGESSAKTLPGTDVKSKSSSTKSGIARRAYRYLDKGGERSAEFPVDPKEDISGVIASASSGALQDFQDKLKAIHLREKGLSKTEISEKIGRSEHWVKRWWREHPAALERPAGANDVVLKKASLHSFRDLDIRRKFHNDASIYQSLVDEVKWRQAKVVARDQNTGELTLRFDERGRSIYAGRQVADYAGGLDFLDKLLQKVFTTMDIRDPQARIFLNWYANGQEKTGVHRHDFWTCLLSFGAPRILTVDNRPILMRDSDLIVFGTQFHGVPVMPDITAGRISLVIFFYPDADNLERQWQTITDDDNEDAATDTSIAGAVPVGIDKGFDASLLWSNPFDQIHSIQQSALTQATKPDTARRALLKSPNSELCFEGYCEGHHVASVKVFSASCSEAADPVQAEKGMFQLLKTQDVHALWDFRARPQKSSWATPENLRRRCAAWAIKYRYYPLGRREAGGVIGHVSSEEGVNILKRLVEAAKVEVTAYLSADDDWQQSGSLRGGVANALMTGFFGTDIIVQHLTSNGLEDHIAQPVVEYANQVSAPETGVNNDAIKSNLASEHLLSSSRLTDNNDRLEVKSITAGIQEDLRHTDLVCHGSTSIGQSGAPLSEDASAQPKRTNRWANKRAETTA